MATLLKKSDSCSLSEKRQALQRALESRTFKRSEQMRSFLEFICEAEFRGEGANLNEYVIGTQVLHRPADYSPAEDSSVRTRAYELRQKLERLYAEELVAEPVRIVIPKGAYTPEFVCCSRTAPVAIPLVPAKLTEQVDSIQTEEPAVARRRSWPILVVACSLALVIGYLLPRPRPAKALDSAHSSPDPVVKDAWAQVAQPDRQSLLLAATPLYLVLGPETHHAFGTPTYSAPPEAYDLFRKHRPLMKDGRLGMLFTDDALGVGSMNAVVIASSTIRSLGGETQILPERTAMMPTIHGRDVVLFGAPVDSEAIAEILEKTPLTVDYDAPQKEFVIRDRTHGSVLAPEMSVEGDFRSVYGLVTVLNTRQSEHGRLGMIVFSGITSVGTHGAAEFFASPSALKALLRVFTQSGISHFPVAYQVVVKCEIQNLQLVSEQYETHRVLQVD